LTSRPFARVAFRRSDYQRVVEAVATIADARRSSPRSLLG